MDKLFKTYAVASILMLIVLAVSPLKDYFRKWRSIQKNYNEYVQKLPQKVEPISIALKQIWARDLDHLDRCVTCHVGINNVALAGAKEPFRAHPIIYHDIEKYGCTICHQGQGLATDFNDAHFSSEFWDKPVLPNRYLEASCGHCHKNWDLPYTPTLNRGRELLKKLGCIGCHDLPASFSRPFVPSLDGIGNKVTSQTWLVRWLKNPEEISPETKMPDFKLSNNEAQLLADFLISFKTFPGGTILDSLPALYLKNKDNDSFIQLGKTKFREARCISCHAIEGKGGHLAVELSKIATKATPVWIYNYIRNPRRFQPEVEMPQYGFSENEAAAVTAYIESEFIDWGVAEDTLPKHVPPPNFYEQGIRLFNNYNCGGCHTLTTAKLSSNKGPDLSSIGSKRIYQIDYGSSDIPHTLYDYIDAKIGAPHLFGATARMPQYKISQTDREALTTVLLSFQTEPVSEKFIVTANTPAKFNIQGRVGEIFRKYSCLKCHTINHTGGTIAPDLSIVGSQLQPQWVEAYFKLPYSLRPIMTERMPNLFISKEEIEILKEYFYTVLVNDSVSIDGEWDQSVNAINRGRGLYWEKYGCQSCHIIGGKGGYVGPPLDDTGNRLKPAWIFKWLMNPAKYKPGTIEPRTGMSVKEAEDLTVYLMSLKTKS